MHPSTHREAERIFSELLDLTPAMRQARLQETCAGRAKLQQEVQALLRASEQADAFFDALRQRLGLGDASIAPVQADQRADRAGQSLGAYTLTHLLGRGGMGEVWCAERADGRYAGRVAIKLLAAPGAISRHSFEREARHLARLSHPNIARLLDADTTAQGQPYLVLECVDGEPIDVHCDQRLLTIEQRVRLFLQVLDAIAHAHANLVVHRDIKPSNVRVTPQGQVKVLDFGISKLVASDEPVAAGESMPTVALALTPLYAAPEQIEGAAVTTATDVYALGLLLWELVAGRTPRSGRELRSLADLRAAALAEPGSLLASATHPSGSQTLAEAARQRGITVGQFEQLLRQDLDPVLRKAVAVEPSERYATASEFAQDLRRYLAHEPVAAHAPSAAYRLRKFVRRHRAPVGASAALLVALLAGVGGTTWQASVARAEQQRAEAVKDFVAGLFTDADPFSTQSKETTVEGLLQSAQARLERVAEAPPAVRVELLLMIGGSYAGLERFDRAEPLFDQALIEARRELGADHELAQRARLALLNVYRHRGRLGDIRTELEALLPVLRAARTPAQRQLLQEAVAMSAHLLIDEGRYAAARDAAQESAAVALTLFGERHAVSAGALLLLATATQFLGDAEATLRHAVRARDVATQVHGDDHARVLDSRMVYGNALFNVGRFRQSRAELEDVFGQMQRRLGEETSFSAYLTNDLSRVALELGDERAALRYAQHCLKILLRNAGPESFPVAMARRQNGRVLLALHRTEDARVEFEHALRVLTAMRGADSPLVLNTAALLALAHAQLGQPDEAWRLLEPRMEAFRQAMPELRHFGLRVAGVVKRLQGDLATAASLLDQALSALPELPVNRTRRNIALGDRALVALEQGDAAAALGWLDRVEQPEGAASPSLEEGARLTTRGRALLALGLQASALDALRVAEVAWQALAPEAPDARSATRWREAAELALPERRR